MARKTIYAAMTGGFGSLAQVLPILEHLDPARFRIACSITQGAAHAIERLGYDLIPYPDVGSPDPALVRAKGRGCHDLDEYWGRFGFADPRYFRALIAARRRLVAQIAPDVLLTQFCPPTEVIARVEQIPLISLTQSCWHPAGKPISWWRPTQSPDDTVRVTPVVNTLLTDHGAAPIGRMEDLNRGDLTFIPSFPEFDPIDDPDARHIGPLHWTSAARIARDRVLSSKRPLVVVYTGHLHDSGGRSGIVILEHVVAALAGTELDVVIATGFGQEIDIDFGGHANISIHEWIALDPLLERCALFIHHGGHGSCLAGIRAGAVALVIPTFQEREFNARQLHALGLADFMLPGELDPGALRERVHALLHDPRTRHNLQRWKIELARRDYRGAERAAALIADWF